MSARKQRRPRHPQGARLTRASRLAQTSRRAQGSRLARRSAPRRVSLTLTVTLTLLWMMLFISVEPLIVASGVLVAVGVQWVVPLPHVTHTYRIRPLPFARLVAHFVWDVLTSGARMAYIVMWTANPRGGIVDVRLNTTDPILMTAISALTSLVPGSVVLDLDDRTGIMRLHIFDLPTSGGQQAVTHGVYHVERMLMDALGVPPQPRAGTRKAARR